MSVLHTYSVGISQCMIDKSVVVEQIMTKQQYYHYVIIASYENRLAILKCIKVKLLKTRNIFSQKTIILRILHTYLHI